MIDKLRECTFQAPIPSVYLGWAGPPEGVSWTGSPEAGVGGEADSRGLAAGVGVGGARGAGVHRTGGA